MKRGNSTLVVVVVAAMVLSGILADDLRERQRQTTPTRSFVSRIPIAGFQKFASDIQWMLFIQYCGEIDGVNPDNAGEIEARVDSIISLDPDFERIYYDGALMLSAKAPERALRILDKGMKHPRIRNNWKLPLLAGMILMRPQMNNYYENKPMDKVQVEKARGYFRAAFECPGHADYVTNNLVRAEAILMDADEQPTELRELQVWYQYWADANSADGLGPMDASLDSRYRGSTARYDRRLMDSLRRAHHAAHSTESTYSDADKAMLIKLSEEIVSTAFRRYHLDPVSLRPYDPGDRYSAHSGAKVDVYGVCQNVVHSDNLVILKGRFCHQCGTDNNEVTSVHAMRRPSPPFPVDHSPKVAPSITP